MRIRMIARWLAVALCLMIGGGHVWAQGLTPPGAPAPTMKRLDEVEPRTAVQTLAGSTSAMHVIDLPGSYYLTGNITADTDKHGIDVQCDNVSIDLCGFTLAGAGKMIGTTGNGINAPLRTQIVVRNGIVREFREEGVYCNSGKVLLAEGLLVASCGGVGIHGYTHVIVRGCNCWQNGSYGILANGELLVENCLVTNNAYAGIGASGAGSMIRGCVSLSNGHAGISAAPGSTVVDCVVYSNSTYGIYAGDGSTVRGCSVYSNTGTGIFVATGCLVADNSAKGNTTEGIQGQTRNHIRDNIVEGSPIGIKTSSTSNVIEGNMVADCTEGIDLSSTTNLYVGNRLSNTTDLVNQGDDVDGGGNISF